MKKSPQETRRKLLHAAVAIIAESGASQFTLDAVAHEAQVSKGGLLHHFPTKDSLLHGIVVFGEQLWLEALQQALEQEPEGVKGRMCRAYIRASFEQDENSTVLTSALARIRNNYPDAFTGFESGMRWFTDDDGLPPGRTLIIQLTCDGLWFAELAGMPPLSADESTSLRSELERLTR